MRKTWVKSAYLAAAWCRLSEAAAFALDLRDYGVNVISSWLHEHPRPAHSWDKYERENAHRDTREIREADIFIRLADDLKGTVPASLASGGRMFEQGYALALGKTVYVVGEPQNIFDRLDQVRLVKDKPTLKRLLCPWEIN